MLQIGDQFPIDISLPNSNGESKSIKELIGEKYLVIYFYPKDMTPGCTLQACSLRDANDSLKSLGANIVGISKDGVNSHKKFEDRFKLNFEILSDENLELIKAAGVYAEKSMFGKKYMGVNRSTFLIDKDGEILYTWPKAKTKGHADEVLKVVEVQQASS